MTFDHIAISVDNVAEAVRFYQQQFPATGILYQDDTWALLKIGDLKMALVIPDQHPPHLAFKVGSREELEEAARQAGEQPIKVHRDRSESFYQQDPFGNRLEVVYYPEEKEA